MTRLVFAPKLLDETSAYQFDFSSLLGVGETISTAACTASVYSGTDPTPSLVVSGAASISGSMVTQLFTAGVLGVIYEVKCHITTSASQTRDLVAFLAILQDLV